MSLLDGFKKWVTGEAEGEDYDYEYEDEVVSEPVQNTAPYSRASAAPMETASARPAVSRSQNGRVVNINATTQLAVVLVKAEQFDSVTDISDHLKNKMTVVLNLETTEKDIATRMLDFLSGVTYAIDGKVKRVSKDTYLITPYNVEIVGEDLISKLEDTGMHFAN